MKSRSSLKGPWLTGSVALALILAGCSTTQNRQDAGADGNSPAVKKTRKRRRSKAPAKTPAKAPAKKAAKKATPTKTPSETPAKTRNTKPKSPPPPPPGDQGGGNKRLEDIARLASLKDQERKALAEHYYKTAKGRYDQLQYREAAADLEIAVKANPESAKIRKFYDKVLWILGDRRGEVYDMARELAETRQAAILQAQIEVDRLYREGELLASKEKYNSAIERFERVLETVRWFPYNISRDELRAKADQAIKTASRNRDEQLRKIRLLKQQAAIEAARAEKAQSLQYINARLKALYRKALEAFKAERYAKVEELTTEILDSRPTDLQASRLRTAAIELRHRKANQEIYYDKVEHFRRQIEWIDETAIPYQSIFEFPGKNEWAEIAKRDVPLRFKEKTSSPKTEAINRRLSSQRVTLNFDGTSFDDALNFLRDITGLNIVVSNDARDLIDSDSLEVSLRLKDISLKNALELILATNSDLIYTIRDGVILITTKDGQQTELFLEFYEVSDIINNVPDYPAPELGLSQQQGGGGGGGGAGGGAGGVLSFDDDEGEEGGGVGVTGEKLLELGEKIAGESDEGSMEISGGILIVRKPAVVHRKIIKLLEALRKTVGIMVTVEARFVSVQDNFLEQIGVDLAGLDDPNQAGNAAPVTIPNARGTGTVGSTAGFQYTDSQGQFNFRSSMINLLSNTIGNGAGNPFNLVSNGGGAFQYNIVTDQYQIQAILEAVKKKQKARMVSAPRVTVFNGQRAHLLSITQRAYIQDVEVNQTGVIPVLNPVIGILNTGSILDVRPTVSYDRKYVMLEVRPTLAQQGGTRFSVVTLAGANTSIPIELPTIVISKIRTSVTVPDGGTVLIGGMKDLQTQYDETLTPMLGKVPVIKNLFRRQGRSSLKRSLIVLLRAKITILREEEKRKFGTGNG